MDRKHAWTLLAAAAALTALAVHLAVPLVQWEDADGTRTVYAHEVDDIVDTQVSGAQWGYMLGGAVALAVGGTVFAAALVLRGTPAAWTRAVGGIMATAGGAMTVHANALWTGRGVSTLLHTMLGTDTPSKEMADLSASSADFPVAVWPIGAPIVLVLAGLALWAAWRAWALQTAQRRGLRDMAVKHARVGTLAMLTLVIALIVPWSMQSLEDGTDPVEGTSQDEDMFLWSPYDVLRIQHETEAAARESREAALVQYTGLAILLQTVAVTGVVTILAAAIAIGGTHLATHGQAVWGRLLENSAFLALMGLAFLVVAAFLGAFWLYDAGDILDSRITAAPLLLLAGGVPALWASGRVVRELAREDGDPVADDFPEPVVYD